MTKKLKHNGLLKYLLIVTFIFAFGQVKAQVQTFQQADSISYALFQQADWKQLIVFGKQAVNSGFDFPYLRLRLGYASFSTGNFKAAIKEYDAVLRNDSYNQIARYYSYLCYNYLNQQLLASYNAAYIDSAQLKKENIVPYDWINAGIESGIKIPRNDSRSKGVYLRLFFSNRLSWKVQLEQAVQFYGQSINNIAHDEDEIREALNKLKSADQQIEYYAKISYAISGNTALLGAYHYLNTHFQTVGYNGNIGFAGIKYASTYFDVQGDLNFGYLLDHYLQQYNAGLTFYPLGNLNLYTVSKGAYLRQNGAGQIIYNQALGFKLFKNLWSETSATFGNLDNYNEADGLYVYNLIDATKLKLGETAFYLFNKHAQLQVNYTFEKKQDEYHHLNYNQHSVTAGILWKF